MSQVPASRGVLYELEQYRLREYGAQRLQNTREMVNALIDTGMLPGITSDMLAVFRADLTAAIEHRARMS